MGFFTTFTEKMFTIVANINLIHLMCISTCRTLMIIGHILSYYFLLLRLCRSCLFIYDLSFSFTIFNRFKTSWAIATKLCENRY